MAKMIRVRVRGIKKFKGLKIKISRSIGNSPYPAKINYFYWKGYICGLFDCGKATLNQAYSLTNFLCDRLGLWKETKRWLTKRVITIYKDKNMLIEKQILEDDSYMVNLYDKIDGGFLKFNSSNWKKIVDGVKQCK